MQQYTLYREEYRVTSTNTHFFILVIFTLDLPLEDITMVIA